MSEIIVLDQTGRLLYNIVPLHYAQLIYPYFQHVLLKGIQKPKIHFFFLIVGIHGPGACTEQRKTLQLH